MERPAAARRARARRRGAAAARRAAASRDDAPEGARRSAASGPRAPRGGDPARAARGGRRGAAELGDTGRPAGRARGRAKPAVRGRLPTPRGAARARPGGGSVSGPGGYFGRALIVDVGDGAAEPLALPEAVLRGCLGGAGLAAWLMHRLAPPRVDPLAPEAPLAFAFSPLVGTPLTTSAKFAVVSKSPLTGMLNDALASSHFAISGKLTGNDALVLRGACPEPSVLLVDGDGARLEPAAELWGLPAAEAERRLRERHGAGWRGGADRPPRARPLRSPPGAHH